MHVHAGSPLLLHFQTAGGYRGNAVRRGAARKWRMRVRWRLATGSTANAISREERVVVAWALALLLGSAVPPG